MGAPDSILVTGATGFVGSHIARALLSEGRRVRLLARSASKADALSRAGAEVALGDLSDRAILRRACAGMEAVVHSAAVLSAPTLEGYRRVNVEGTHLLLEASLEEGCASFLLVSSVAAGGPARGGRPVGPADPPRPVSHYGRSKREAEEVLGRQSGRIRTCAFRPPVVYGPGDRGLLPLFCAAARGLVVRAGRVRRIDLIHVEDLVAAICAALRAGLPTGAVHCARGEGPVSPEEVLARAARAFGARPRRLPIPSFVLAGAAAGADLWARLRPSSGLVFGWDKWREMREQAWTCDDRAFREASGWVPAVPLEEGIASTARWYLERGWVRPRGGGRATGGRS